MSATPSPLETPSPVAAERVLVRGEPIRRPPGLLGVRAAVDGLACLAVAVLLLRAFEVEGYMISTGSMAPALYGYHKRVVCPTCGEAFTRGVAFDGSGAFAGDEDDLQGGGKHAVCPNCGQGAISVDDVPRNHGDQLLVLKHAYELRPPKRWEVIVFRNPNHPVEAFVKRVAGLPGERVQVRDGDVYANGEICRKPLETQRAMRIAVFEADRAPVGHKEWKPRWEGDAGWTAETTAGGRTFAFRPPAAGSGAGDDEEFSWLAYHHRLRSGGSHETAVPVRNVPEGFEVSDSPFVEPVRFEPSPDDPFSGVLVAVGAVDDDWERRLRDLWSDRAYQAAVTKLVERSRESPITDGYAYNRSLGLTPNPVRDLMVEFALRVSEGGRFAVEMSDGRDRFRLVADAAAGTLSLVRAATGEELRSAALPAGLLEGDGATVEMSVMDRQVLVAVDGREPFAAWTYDEPVGGGKGIVGVRLGATGAGAEVRSLVLYRDVHYTRGKARNGVDVPYGLEDEYFVLGDNSPVSLDSRSWPDGAVPAKLLLGKPFVVHLPSRPGTLKLGKRELTVRIPDFERMRYIR